MLRRKATRKIRVTATATVLARVPSRINDEIEAEATAFKWSKSATIRNALECYYASRDTVSR